MTSHFSPARALSIHISVKKPNFVQTHRMLTLVGVILLAVTYLINYHMQVPEGEFNYAYITGVAMLFCFAASFFFFHRDKKVRLK